MTKGRETEGQPINLDQAPMIDPKITEREAKELARRANLLKRKIFALYVIKIRNFMFPDLETPEFFLTGTPFPGNPADVSEHYIRFASKRDPFRVAGSGGVSFNFHAGNEYDELAEKLGVRTRSHVSLTFHTDEATREDVEAFLSAHPATAFNPETRFFFDKAGHFGKAVLLPAKTHTRGRPTIERARGEGKWIGCPMTPLDFEMAGTALNVLSAQMIRYQRRIAQEMASR